MTDLRSEAAAMAPDEDALVAVEMTVHALMGNIRSLALDLNNPERADYVAAETGHIVHAAAMLTDLVHEIQAKLTRRAA